MDPVQESQLLQAASAGDDAALERVILRYHSRLAADLEPRLPTRLRGHVSVDDILQEAYVSVFRDIRSFESRGPGAFYAWLALIAERKLFDAVKAQAAAKRGGNRMRESIDMTLEDGSVVECLSWLAQDERSPSQSIARREAVDAVRLAVSGLKSDYQDVLRMRYLEGLSVAETAARMNRTEGAISLLSHRALRALQGLLGNRSISFQVDQ